MYPPGIGATVQGPASPNTASSVSELGKTLDQLEAAISNVYEAVMRLEDRLSPTLSPANEVKEGGSGALPHPTPLIATLHLDIDRINTIGRWIDELRNRSVV